MCCRSATSPVRCRFLGRRHGDQWRFCAVKRAELLGSCAYNGKIERSIQSNEDGSWSVNTRGTGNNVIPGFSALNAWHGPLVFREVDRQMRSYIERDRRGR